MGDSGMQATSTLSKNLLVVLALKFFQAFGYYGLSIILPLLLTEDMGASDREAGFAYGMFGMSISVFSLFSGPLADRFGVKNCLAFGAILTIIGRFMLLGSSNVSTATIILSSIMAIGESFGVPVLSVLPGLVVEHEGGKDIEGRKAFAYGLFYTALNIAVLLIGPTVDAIRNRFASEGRSPYQTMGTLCAYVGVVSCGVTFLFLPRFSKSAAKEEIVEDVDNTEKNKTEPGEETNQNTELDHNQPNKPSLWNFLLLSLLLVGVRSLFRFLDAMFPKYMIRYHGEHVPFGLIYSINPMTVILLVPLLSSLRAKGEGLITYMETLGMGDNRGRGNDKHKNENSLSLSLRWLQIGFVPIWRRLFPFVVKPVLSFLLNVSKLPSLQSIAIGTVISTCSVIWLALFTSEIASALFVFTLSVGEALWSPRFYDFTSLIAPKGKAGLYFAIANLPLFLPKLLSGVLSGWLLEEYCEMDKCEHPRKLWFVVFVLTVPFGLGIVGYYVKNR
eukprot:m.40245 g.40245  ORF g.40245 m.40245 type:complete len:503 (+) comp6912_c0_seq4:91-1599(+)